MIRTARIGGLSLIAFALAFVTTFALESLRVTYGFDDGDNPEQSVAFIKEHSNVYEASGVAQIFMTLALIVGTLAVADTVGEKVPSLAVRSLAVIGLFAAFAFFLNGALRLAAARPLLYIDSLRHEWGLTAYLVVQMAGVQGFTQAAVVNLSLWAVGVSVLNLRRRFFPLTLSWLGVLPAFHVSAGLFGPFLGDSFENLFFLYVLSIFGTTLWCLFLGIVLLRLKPARPLP